MDSVSDSIHLMRQTHETDSGASEFWSPAGQYIGDRTEIQSIDVVNLLGNITEGDEMAVNENGSYAQRDLFPTAQSTSPLPISSRYSAAYRWLGGERSRHLA